MSRNQFVTNAVSAPMLAMNKNANGIPPKLANTPTR